jgi:hypothetical protein
MERLCLDCQQPLIGRSDKKFCDDACRSNYYNRMQHAETGGSCVRRINRTLKHNYRILQQLNPEGKIKIPRAKMIRAGFDFTYFTHLYETGKGARYHFCYDHGYLQLNNDDVLLVIKKDAP